MTNFGFNTRNQTSPIGLLSDGQKSRLVFAMLAMKPSGVLLLDEPTNDLDVETLRSLEDALRVFVEEQGGCVVVVSHDRWFLDRLSTHTLVLDAGRYPGVGAGADVSLVKKEKEEMTKKKL